MRNDPGEVLLVASRAIVAVEEGRPFDLTAARAFVLAVADRLEAGAVNPRIDDEGRAAAQTLALTTTALARVFDALADCHTSRARVEFRRALWAPAGDAALLDAIDQQLNDETTSEAEFADLLFQRTVLADVVGGEKGDT